MISLDLQQPNIQISRHITAQHLIESKPTHNISLKVSSQRKRLSLFVGGIP